MSTKVLLMIGVVGVLVGCATMPGNVSSTTSKLDGERQVHVEPGWIYAGGLKSSDIKLGGFWSGKRPTNFVLEVVIVDTENIEGLKVGVDGEISEFKPSEQFTDHSYVPGSYNSFASYPGHAESAKRFVVPLDFIEKMVAGKKVVVRVQMSRGYTEGEFSFDQMTFARPAFRKALLRIRETKNAK